MEIYLSNNQHNQHVILKKRTTIILSVDLIAELDRICGELGVSRSNLFALAANCFVAQVAPMLKPTRRAESLTVIQEIFDKLMKKALEAA